MDVGARRSSVDSELDVLTEVFQNKGKHVPNEAIFCLIVDGLLWGVLKGFFFFSFMYCCSFSNFIKESKKR